MSNQHTCDIKEEITNPLIKLAKKSKNKHFNLILLSDTKHARFNIYYDLAQKIKDVYDIFNIFVFDYKFLFNNSFTIPYIEGNSVVKLFSPWYDVLYPKQFYMLGSENKDQNIKDLEKIVQSNFFSNLPETTSGFNIFLNMINNMIDHYVENYIFVNPPQSIYAGRDKNLMSKILIKNNMPYPKTLTDVKSVDDIFRFYKHLKSQNINKIYLKPISGSLGKGITVINNDRVFTNIVVKNKNTNKNTNFRDITNFSYSNEFREVKDKEAELILNFLVYIGVIAQQAVPLAKINYNNHLYQYDFRKYYSFGDISWSFLKVSNNFATNISLGGHEVDFSLLEHELKKRNKQYWLDKINYYTYRLANLFNANDVAIDLAFDDSYDSLYCIELNFFPGLPGIVMRYGKKIDASKIPYIIELKNIVNYFKNLYYISS